MKKLKFRGKEENGKKPQNDTKKKEFSNTNRLIAGIMTVATAFGIAGCSDKFAVANNNNHNDGSVDVNEVMDAAIDALLQDSRPDVNNPRDVEVDVPNHPDAAVDASEPDSSVVDSSVEDSSVVDASYDSSVPDANQDSSIVCEASLCHMPFFEVWNGNIDMNDAVDVGNMRIRYDAIIQQLSPTQVEMSIECACPTGGFVVLRSPVALEETMEHSEEFLDHPIAGENWRVKMIHGTANTSYVPIAITVEQM